MSDLRFPALVLPNSIVGVAGGGGDARDEPSWTFCRLCALIHRGLGSGVGGSLEEDGVSCCSESEGRGRFRVGRPNLGERRGEGGGLAVVRRWTAIAGTK